MAYLFDVNNGAPGSGPQAYYQLKELLKLAGWTVVASSDGTTYNASGDESTSGSAGAGGLNNSLAWFRIREPGTNLREFTFQKDSSQTYNWRIKYSGGPGTGFTGGSPSATQTPSATDEIILQGSGTDAAPGFQQQFDTPDNGWKFNACASNTAPYTFYMWTHLNGNTYVRTFFMLDVMQDGTFLAGDSDPAVVYLSNFSSGILNSDLLGYYAYSPNGWILKGLGGAGWVPIIPCQQYTDSYVFFPNKSGLNPYTSKDMFFPISYGRDSVQTAPVGFKGVSSLMRWMGSARSSFDTFNVNTTKDWLAVSGSASSCYIVLPWNGSDVVL